jgi:hypothetical protein
MGSTIEAGTLGGRFGYLRFGDGLSTGGLIALALGDPDAVDRLALVVSGARIAEPGRRLCADWLRLAAARDWRGVRASLATAVVDGRLARRLVRTLVRRSDPPHGPDGDDFVVTVEAALAHDTTHRLAALSVPALLIGGNVDMFFPEPVLRAPAGRHMRLRVLPAGHGLPKRHAGRLQAELATFLAR